MLPHRLQPLASTSQGPRPFGVGDMTKVLPKPDPFPREEEFAQWPQWSWTFEQYFVLLGSQLQQ